MHRDQRGGAARTPARSARNPGRPGGAARDQQCAGCGRDGHVDELAELHRLSRMRDQSRGSSVMTASRTSPTPHEPGLAASNHPQCHAVSGVVIDPGPQLPRR